MDLPPRPDIQKHSKDDLELAETLNLDIDELILARDFFNGLDRPLNRDENRLLLKQFSTARNQEQQGSPGVSIPYALETSLRNTFFLKNQEIDGNISSVQNSMRPRDNSIGNPKAVKKGTNNSMSINLATDYVVRMSTANLSHFITNYLGLIGLTDHTKKIESGTSLKLLDQLKSGMSLETALRNLIESTLFSMDDRLGESLAHNFSNLESTMPRQEILELTRKVFIDTNYMDTTILSRFQKYMESGLSMESALKKVLEQDDSETLIY